MAAGVGVTELVLIVAMLFGGGAALPPLSVPLPPDAGLQSAAPEECLLYISHAGVAKPQANSTNQVEQLLAEPEIQAFVGEVERLIGEGLKKAPTENEQQRVLTENLPIVVKTLLLRPSMLYVSRVVTPPLQPGGNAGLIVNAGEHAADLAAALEEFEKLYLAELPPDKSVEKSKSGGAELRRLPVPPGAPPVVWGVKDQYVFLALGEKEAETIVERLTAKAGAPKWLSELHEELAIPRTGGIAYLNAGAVIKTVEPLFPLIAQGAPPALRDLGKLLDVSGLRHLRYIALASGLETETAVTKISLAHDGKAEGLWKVAASRPLTLDDLRDIPRTAEFASVGRFDAKSLYETLLGIAGQIDPQARQEAEAALGQAQEQLGFSIEKDLLAGLGDTWSLYNSSNEGGLLLTGLCLSVSVRDSAKVEKVLDRILRLAEANARDSEQRPFDVRKTTVGERTISYVQIMGPSPVAPAWCLTDDRLVVALSPQMVRSHLSRPAGGESLADEAVVVKRLATGDVTSVSYQNTQLGMQAIYSYAQFLATAGAGMLEKETGIRADLAKFPSLGAISRHMRPSVHVSRNTKSGLVMESYAVGPSVDVFSAPAAGVMLGLLLPAVQKAREAASGAQSMNNLRQIGLALLSYEAAEGHFPPQAIKDADGKPLLSWRVAILPQVDQAALYEQFHRDEPWDSPHNIKLVAQMPAVFQHPMVKFGPQEGKTVYQLPVGPGTLYDAKRISLAEFQRAGIPSSGSALVVEAARGDAVVWTKPDDLELDLNNVVVKLLDDRRGSTTIMTADGAAQKYSLSDKTKLEELLFPR